MDRKLRVGILTDSERVPAWAYRMIQIIQDSDYADVHLIVTNAARLDPSRSFLQRLASAWRRLGLILYLRLEGLLVRVEPDAFEPRSLEQLLPDTPRLEVKPRQTQYSDYFPEDALAAVRESDLDVLIRLGFRILRGEILTVARYGVWSFHHGDNRVNRGGPPAYWEVMEKWPETGSVLQILSEDLDAGLVLCRSFQTTDRASVRRNRNALYWKSLSFLPRKLEELHEKGGQAFLAWVREENRHPAFYSKRLVRAPDNIEAARLAVRNGLRYLGRRLWSRFNLEQWILLYALRRDGDLSTSLWRFRKIVPPPDRFWADPHVLYRDGRYYVFIEEFLFGPQKGRISLIRMDEEGRYEDPVPVLEAPYHLSYPHVFEHDGVVYMLPETLENRTVELYRAVDFPRRWERAAVLMEDVEAVDATVIRRDGRWWMFVNLAENRGASLLDELFLFSSDDLLSGCWRPHPLNPVVSDVKRARPAGRIFAYRGALYRPAQNGMHRYGYGVTINEIRRLDPEVYEENPVGRIEPGWDDRIVATHTLSFERGLTLVDGLLRRSRWW